MVSCGMQPEQVRLQKAFFKLKEIDWIFCSKQKVRKALQAAQAHMPLETGYNVLRGSPGENNSAGKLHNCAYARVAVLTDVIFAAIETGLRMDGPEYVFPDCIPADECWLSFFIDSGGGALIPGRSSSRCSTCMGLARTRSGTFTSSRQRISRACPIIVRT